MAADYFGPAALYTRPSKGSEMRRHDPVTSPWANGNTPADRFDSPSTRRATDRVAAESPGNESFLKLKEPEERRRLFRPGILRHKASSTSIKSRRGSITGEDRKLQGPTYATQQSIAGLFGRISYPTHTSVAASDSATSTEEDATDDLWGTPVDADAIAMGLVDPPRDGTLADTLKGSFLGSRQRVDTSSVSLRSSIVDTPTVTKGYSAYDSTNRRHSSRPRSHTVAIVSSGGQRAEALRPLRTVEIDEGASSGRSARETDEELTSQRTSSPEPSTDALGAVRDCGVANLHVLLEKSIQRCCDRCKSGASIGLWVWCWSMELLCASCLDDAADRVPEEVRQRLLKECTERHEGLPTMLEADQHLLCSLANALPPGALASLVELNRGMTTSRSASQVEDRNQVLEGIRAVEEEVRQRQQQSCEASDTSAGWKGVFRPKRLKKSQSQPRLRIDVGATRHSFDPNKTPTRPHDRTPTQNSPQPPPLPHRNALEDTNLLASSTPAITTRRKGKQPANKRDMTHHQDSRRLSPSHTGSMPSLSSPGDAKHPYGYLGRGSDSSLSSQQTLTTERSLEDQEESSMDGSACLSSTPNLAHTRFQEASSIFVGMLLISRGQIDDHCTGTTQTAGALTACIDQVWVCTSCSSVDKAGRACLVLSSEVGAHIDDRHSENSRSSASLVPLRPRRALETSLQVQALPTPGETTSSCPPLPAPPTSPTEARTALRRATSQPDLSGSRQEAARRSRAETTPMSSEEETPSLLAGPMLAGPRVETNSPTLPPLSPSLQPTTLIEPEDIFSETAMNMLYSLGYQRPTPLCTLAAVTTTLSSVSSTWTEGRRSTQASHISRTSSSENFSNPRRSSGSPDKSQLHSILSSDPRGADDDVPRRSRMPSGPAMVLEAGKPKSLGQLIISPDSPTLGRWEV